MGRPRTIYVQVPIRGFVYYAVRQAENVREAIIQVERKRRGGHPNPELHVEELDTEVWATGGARSSGDNKRA